MRLVFLASLLVGGSTMLGAAAGFFCKHTPARFGSYTMAASAGVMLATSVAGLLLPAMDAAGRFGFAVLFGGVGLACASMAGVDRLSARLTRRFTAFQNARSALLFAFVIAVHNFPEGLAAGVGFGREETGQAMAVAIGIALQNLPEGMVTVTPLLAVGVPPVRALLFGLSTGAVEVFGTLLGCYAVRLCAPLLPFALSFAGGCMLYVIFTEMLTKEAGMGRGEIRALLIGFCVMLAMDHLLA